MDEWPTERRDKACSLTDYHYRACVHMNRCISCPAVLIRHHVSTVVIPKYRRLWLDFNVCNIFSSIDGSKTATSYSDGFLTGGFLELQPLSKRLMRGPPQIDRRVKKVLKIRKMETGYATSNVVGRDLSVRQYWLLQWRQLTVMAQAEFIAKREYTENETFGH